MLGICEITKFFP
ncbi:TPA: hypothetical protein MD877_001719 [Morganella morganii]|nr:hypothetical protein [Morganella morganii]